MPADNSPHRFYLSSYYDKKRAEERMIDWFIGLSHPIQAMIATFFTWSITAIGAGLVFCFKK